METLLKTACRVAAEYRAYYNLEDEHDPARRRSNEVRIARLLEHSLALGPGGEILGPGGEILGLDGVISDHRSRWIPGGRQDRGGRAINVVAEMVLVTGICGGDPRACTEFLARYGSCIIDLIRRRGGVIALQALAGFAEQLLMRVDGKPSKWEGYEGTSGIVAFLDSEIRHRWLDWLRAKDRYQLHIKKSHSVNPGQVPVDPFQQAADRDIFSKMVASIGESLSTFTPSDRLMLVLIYVNHLPQRLVAQMLRQAGASGSKKKKWTNAEVSRRKGRAIATIQARLVASLPDYPEEVERLFHGALISAFNEHGHSAIRTPHDAQVIERLIRSAMAILTAQEKALLRSAEPEQFIHDGLGPAPDRSCPEEVRRRYDAFRALSKVRCELDDHDGFRKAFGAHTDIKAAWNWLAGEVRRVLAAE